jgi:hypothetical protein
VDAGDVATEADHGEVDDGVDAGGVQVVEAADGVGHTRLLVPGRGGVGGDFGVEDEDVLVHERRPERFGGDVAPHGRHHGRDATKPWPAGAGTGSG